jgi:hypothetical protein
MNCIWTCFGDQINAVPNLDTSHVLSQTASSLYYAQAQGARV